MHVSTFVLMKNKAKMLFWHFTVRYVYTEFGLKFAVSKPFIKHCQYVCSADADVQKKT